MEEIKAKINPELKKRLPRTYDILKNSGLMIHPYVYKVILTGSRGLAGHYRDDSDIDLSLLVDVGYIKPEEDQEGIFKEILAVTLSSWKSNVELDTAVVFDICNCCLICFDAVSLKDMQCRGKGIGCIGVYKLQKGFSGYVPKTGLKIELMQPMIVVHEGKKFKEPLL